MEKNKVYNYFSELPNVPTFAGDKEEIVYELRFKDNGEPEIIDTGKKIDNQKEIQSHLLSTDLATLIAKYHLTDDPSVLDVDGSTSKDFYFDGYNAPKSLEEAIALVKGASAKIAEIQKSIDSNVNEEEIKKSEVINE